MRRFIIPMQAPVSGKGTRLDPWRPKYLRELKLDFSAINRRDVCLAEVWGDAAAIESLAQMPDVTEVKNERTAEIWKATVFAQQRAGALKGAARG